MLLGLFLGAFVPPTTPEFLVAAAQAAEARGFNSLWLGEHVVLFDTYAKEYPYNATGAFPVSGVGGLVEPWTTLAFLAGQTSRIRLGTSVCLVPQRNPLHTAKEVANVDWVSGGRVDFGIGVGWMREEFEALGVPWERRGARNDEYIEVIRRLWCDEVSSHQGEFWTLPPSRAYPKPVQQPHPPIHVGGNTDVALRRVARLDAHWMPVSLTPDELAARRRVLAGLLEGRGRSVEDVFITVSPTRRPAGDDLVEQYAAAGADQLLVNLRRRVTMAEVEAALDDLAGAFGIEAPSAG
jgi:probable F420-dependent oxidoreductase